MFVPRGILLLPLKIFYIDRVLFDHFERVVGFLSLFRFLTLGRNKSEEIKANAYYTCTLTELHGFHTWDLPKLSAVFQRN